MSVDFTIKDLQALGILASRESPTLRVEAKLGSGAAGRAGVPTGAFLQIAATHPHQPYGLAGAKR